jgi:hypothetical protein
MSNDEKEARVRAKIAKAEAKALRPFWKKKRWWLLGVVVLIGVGGIASGNSDDSTNEGNNKESSGVPNAEVVENTVGRGLGSKDATGDVVDLSCGASDALGFAYPEVTIRNNSSKTSTYFITLVAESADGSIRYDDTIIMIDSLQPNQMMTESGMFTNDLPSGAVCKITEIQRTAS